MQSTSCTTAGDAARIGRRKPAMESNAAKEMIQPHPKITTEKPLQRLLSTSLLGWTRPEERKLGKRKAQSRKRLARKS